MTIEEIRKNAPEGATHYRNKEFVKHECGNWYIFYKGNWNKIHPIVFSEFKDEIKPL